MYYRLLLLLLLSHLFVNTIADNNSKSLRSYMREDESSVSVVTSRRLSIGVAITSTLHLMRLLKVLIVYGFQQGILQWKFAPAALKAIASFLIAAPLRFMGVPA